MAEERGKLGLSQKTKGIYLEERRETFHWEKRVRAKI